MRTSIGTSSSVESLQTCQQQKALSFEGFYRSDNHFAGITTMVYGLHAPIHSLGAS